MSKHKKKLLCIISFAVIVSISFAHAKIVLADENFRVAKIKSFSGKVKIGKGGGEKTFDAIEGMSLVEGDSITTEKDSSALLYIDDDKEVKIGDNSIVNLSELSGYIDSDDQKTGISLWVGKIFSNIKKKLKIRSKYEIKVPTAVMGVRGTQFSVESLADGDIRVIVLEGTVTAVRTLINGAEKYITFEITITKDQSTSMNQNDQSQSDITITGIKINETSLFVLEILKDFIERNPESLDENAKNEIYAEIDKRISEKSDVEEDDSGIEQPVIRMDPIVEENMVLNNVMSLANSEEPNIQPENMQQEDPHGNQFVQANLLNAPAETGQQTTIPIQQGEGVPTSEQGAGQQGATQSKLPIADEPKPEQETKPPIAEQPKPKQASVRGGGTTHSNETNADTPVTLVNAKPSVQNSSVQTKYSTMASGIIIASDVNGDTLSYALGETAEHGTVVVNSETGAWEYTPAQQFTGTDSFVVTVSDGKGGIVTSTVTVIVMSNANTVAIAQDGNLTANQNATVNGQLIVTNVDANTTLTYIVTSNPAHGTVTLNGNGSYTYTPEANYYGIDSFKFKVNDGTADSNEATVRITVSSANDLPIVENYNVETEYGTMASGTIAPSYADGDTLDYAVTTPALYGTATVDSATGAWEYTPAQQFTGTDSFVVTVSDEKGGSVTSTVTVTVKAEVVTPPPANTAPIVEDYGILINYTSMAAVTIAASDPDGDILSYTISEQPTYGTAAVDSSTGVCEYTPMQQFPGYDSFIVTVSDEKGGSATSNVIVVDDLGRFKSLLTSIIGDIEGWASQMVVGTGLGECSSQQAIDDLTVAIANAQDIQSKPDATINEINEALNELIAAKENVENNIVNTLEVTTPAAVSVNTNFYDKIEVKLGTGYFSSDLSTSNITLGGSFAGLIIDAVSVDQDDPSIAEIKLSGNLSTVGTGTITINADGVEYPVNSKDITASIVVNP